MNDARALRDRLVKSMDNLQRAYDTRYEELVAEVKPRGFPPEAIRDMNGRSVLGDMLSALVIGYAALVMSTPSTIELPPLAYDKRYED